MRGGGGLIFSVAVLAAIAAPPARADCPPPAVAAVAVDGPADGTIRLADGRVLRLAGVELSDDGRRALPGLVRRGALTVRPVGRPDRWGRQPAHVDRIEETLLLRGLGHAARQAEGACLAPLLAAEAKARAARAGVWSDDGYMPGVRDGPALTGRLGQHIVAEGSVVSARTVRGRVYLNFARYWKSGLSLIIAEKDWPMFAGGAPAGFFVGKRLRARGRLEWRSGPAVLAGPDDRIELSGQ
jgi:hypothetical protein